MKPFKEMEDKELLVEYRVAKRGNIVLCDEGAAKRYKLALKSECARRGILPISDDGEDQNFRQPSAEVFNLAVRLGGTEVITEEVEALRAAG